MDVAAWGIDSYAITEAIKVINSMSQYEARSLGVGATLPDIDAIINEARKAEVDAVALIQPSGYTNQPHYVGGYGFHRRSTFGIQRDCTYSLFVTRVFAVNSGRELGWEWSFPSLTTGMGCYGQIADGKPWTMKMDWRESPGDYTEKEMEKFREDILKSITESISYSLTHVGL